MIRRLHLLALGFAVAARLASSAHGADKATPAPELRLIHLSNVASSAATAVGIPVATLELEPSRSVCHPGDLATLAVTVEEDGRERQWVVLLKGNTLKPKERELRSPSMTLYTTWGAAIPFPPAPLGALAIRTLGPFGGKKDKPHDIWSGALINPQFLGIGLHGTAGFFYRTQSHPVSFEAGTGPSPFPPETVEKGRALARELQITDEESKSFAGSMPALWNFVTIAAQTEGIRDILFEMIDLPVSALFGNPLKDLHVNLRSPIDRMDPAAWGLPPGTELYSLPFEIQLRGRTALCCRAAVTRPTPPLLNSAGIVGFTASRPNGKGPRLAAQLIATRPATGLPVEKTD